MRGTLRAKFELSHSHSHGLHLAFQTPWGSRIESHFPLTTPIKVGNHSVTCDSSLLLEMLLNYGINFYRTCMGMPLLLGMWILLLASTLPIHAGRYHFSLIQFRMWGLNLVRCSILNLTLWSLTHLLCSRKLYQHRYND